MFDEMTPQQMSSGVLHAVRHDHVPVLSTHAWSTVVRNTSVEDDCMVRDFLGVRNHCICKASTKRLTYLKQKPVLICKVIGCCLSPHDCERVRRRAVGRAQVLAHALRGGVARRQGPNEVRKAKAAAEFLEACDYSDGEWVPDARPPLYNGTSCVTINNGQNCMAHLYWRWRPRGCELPAFSPDVFLRWLRNRHLAFVGDSLARNQAESLLRLLSSRSPSELAYCDGKESQFRLFVFCEHNATVSVLWSLFMVRTVEKDECTGVRHNVFLNLVKSKETQQGIILMEIRSGEIPNSSLVKHSLVSAVTVSQFQSYVLRPQWVIKWCSTEFLAILEVTS